MSEKKNPEPAIPPKYLLGKLEKVLKRINEEGNFKASIVSTLDGFSIASISSQFDDVVLSAISTIFQEASKRAEDYIGFKRMDEVSLVDDDKVRMVCREFQAGELQLILTVVVPPYQTYRRLTNIAIREIEKIIQRKETE